MIRRDKSPATRRWFWLLSLAVLSLIIAGIILLEAAPSLEGHEQHLRGEARHEGALIIYSATDEAELSDLLKLFAARYPFIKLTYRSLDAREVYESFRREAEAGKPTADLIINSAMDLQIKLVNDGFAQSYASPYLAELPSWAVWRNEAFAVTSEPIVIGYNRSLLKAGQVPRSHDDLAVVLRREPERFFGRVAAYDPSLSPTGYLYYTQDVQLDRDSWDLFSAIGRVKPRLFTSAHTMIEKVSAGELLLAYNVIGSYAFERAAHDPNFGVVIPEDYVMVMSRVALIARHAAHPASAKLFLDFLLSQQGQALLARHHMTPVRTAMEDEGPSLAGANVRAVRLRPALMAAIDEMTRGKFLKKWNETMAPQYAGRGPSPSPGYVN